MCWVIFEVWDRTQGVLGYLGQCNHNFWLHLRSFNFGIFWPPLAQPPKVPILWLGFCNPYPDTILLLKFDPNQKEIMMRKRREVNISSWSVCTFIFRRETSLLLFQPNTPSVFKPTLHICIIPTSSIWCLNTQKSLFFFKGKNEIFLTPNEYIPNKDV